MTLFKTLKGVALSAILMAIPAFSIENPFMFIVNKNLAKKPKMTIALVDKSSINRDSDSKTTIKMILQDFREDSFEKEGSSQSYNKKTQAPIVARVSHSKKELYLTFDDGPLRGTSNVIRVLREEGVNATMFFVAKHAERRPDLYMMAKAMPNILIANHTYSHANGHYKYFYSSSYRVASDIEHAQLLLGGRKFLRLAGRNVWRTPEVSRDDRAIGRIGVRREDSKYNLLAKEGFFIYGWDVEWHFSHKNGHPTMNANAVAKRIEMAYKKGRLAQRGKVILLAHDFMFRDKNSVRELKKFISIMRKRGWSFKKIDKYSKVTPTTLRYARYYKKSYIALSKRYTKFKNRVIPTAKDKEIINIQLRKKSSIKNRAISKMKIIQFIQSEAIKNLEYLLHKKEANRYKDFIFREVKNSDAKSNSTKSLLARDCEGYKAYLPIENKRLTLALK